MHLQPGESKRVTISVPGDKLFFCNSDTEAFEVPRGEWGVTLGALSADIRLQKRFVE